MGPNMIKYRIAHDIKKRLESIRWYLSIVGCFDKRKLSAKSSGNIFDLKQPIVNYYSL